MVTVTLTGTPNEVHSEAREFFQLQEVTIKTPPLKEVVKEAIKKAEPKEKVVEKVAEKTEAPKETVKETASAASADLELEIKKLIPQVMAHKDRATVVKLLDKYGAKKGSDVKAADQAAFIAEAKSMLPKE